MRKTTLSATVSSAKPHASKHFPKRAHLLASTALVAGMAMSGAALAQQTWDPNAAAGVQGGAGAWDAATANWTTDAGASNVTYNGTAPVPEAVFGTAGGAVTVTGTQNVNNLTFDINGYTVSGGSLALAAGTNTITVTSGTATISSQLTQPVPTAGLDKVGGGTLVLNGANTYTGETRVFDGTLTAGNVDAFGTGGNLRSGGGIIDLGGLNITKFSTIVQNGALNNGTLNMTAGLQVQNAAIGAVLSGVGQVISAGLGTSTLSAANTFTGAIIANRGTLDITGSTVSTTVNITDLDNIGAGVVAHGSSLADQATVTISNSGVLTLAGNEQIGALSSASATASVNLQSNTLIIDPGAALLGAQTFAGDISGSGGITLAGANADLTLSGANSFTGTATITAGALRLTGGSSFADSSTVLMNGGNLSVAGAATIGAFSGASGAANNFAVNIAGELITSAADTAARTYSSGMAGAGTFTKGGTDDLTLSGQVTVGNVGVTGGTLALTNTGNTMSAISVGGGRLNIGASGTTNSVAIATGATATIGVTGSVTNASAITATGTTALTVNVGGADNATLSGAIATGMGSLTRSGTGTLNLTNGTSTYGTFNANAGTTNVSAGAMGLAAVNGGSLTISGTATLGTATVNNGTLTLNAGAPATITVGDGVAGPGTDRLVIGTALTGATTITTQGSVIEYLADSAALINLNSNDTQLEVAAGPARTQSGIISQTGGARPLEKIGAGELILSADNSYTGQTTVSAGRLNVTGNIDSTVIEVLAGAGLTADGTAIADTAAITLTNAADLSLTGSETIGTITAANAASTVQLGANTLTVAGAGASSVAGVISGVGGALVKQGAGDLTLTGTNTFSGDTTISGGAIVANSAAALGANTSDLVLDGGTLTTSTGASLTKNEIRMTQSSTLAAAAGQTLALTTPTLRLQPAAAATLTFGTALQTGTVRINGSAFSTNANASVALNFGTLQIGNAATGAGLLSAISGTAIGANGTIDINGQTTDVTALTGTGTVTSNGAAASLRTAGTTSFGGVIQDGAGATGLNVIGGTTTLTGANTYTGATLLSGGNLTLSGAGSLASTDVTINATRSLSTQGGLAAGTALVNNGTLTLTGNETIGSLAGTNAAGSVNTGANTLITGGLDTSTAYAGIVSGTNGTLVKTGTGTQTLSANNTITNLTVQDGTLLLSGDNSAVDLITVGGGSVGEVGRLRLENNLAGGTLIRTQGSVVSYADGVTMATPIQLNSNDTQLEVLAAAAATQSGVISDFNATPRPIEKIGAGTLTLSATNTYGGATTVSAGTLTLTGSIDSPTVTVNGTAALNLDNGDALLDTAAVVLNGNGAMALANANSETIGSLAGSATSSVNLNANTLTVGNAGAATTTMAGAISGTGGITKTGASTLALTGTNSYTGRTRISGGTLSLNNGSSLGAAISSIDLNGGTLLGTANATLAKNEIQLLTSSTIAAAGGTTLGLTPTTFRLAPAAASTLRIGTVSQAGTVVVNASGVTSNANATVSIDAGTLRMGNAAAGSSLLELIGGTNVGSAGALDMNGNNTRVNVLTGAGTVTNSNAAAATLQTSGSSSFGGNIQNGAGTAALTVLADTLTLTQANGYTGATTLSGGNLTLSGNGALASTSVNLGSNMLSTDGAGLAAATAVTSAGGTLDLFGNETIASYNGTGAISVTGLSNALTLNNGASAVGAVISGTGGLTVTGSSVTSLTAANTYQGGTIISGGGHLTVSGAGTLGAATGSTMISGGTLTINTDVTQFNVTQSGGVINGTNTLTATNQFNHIGLIINSAVETPVFSMQGGEISSTGSVTASNRSELNGTSAINGTLDGAGTGAATVQTGTTTLGATGAITNMVAVNVDDGAALTTGGAQQIDDAAIVTVDGTLTLGGNETLSGLNGGANGIVDNGGNTLTLGTTGGSFDGAINGAGGLIVTGGTQTLTRDNGYTGATDITGGTLSVINNGTLASTDLETASGATLSTEGDALLTTAVITNAGTLSLNGNEEVASVSGAGGIDLANGDLTLNAGASTISGVISGTNDLWIIGSSATTLSGANTYTGDTEVEGALTVTGTGEIAGATDVSDSGTMTNAGAVQEVRNAGTLTNSGTAGEVRNSGTLSNSGTTGAAINTGTGTNTGTIASLAQQSGSFANNGTVSGNAAVTGGTLNHSGTVAGNLTVAVGSIANVNAGTVSGTTTNNGGTVNIDSGTFTGNVNNVAGTLTAAGTVSAAIENAATMTVTSPAAFDLTGTIINTGTGLFTTSGAVATSGGLTNSGTVNAQGALNSAVANNAAFNVTGPLTATGQDFANAANLTIGANSYTGIGTLTNSSSATIDLSAGGTLGTTTLTNNGTVNANDATVWGGITNSMAFNAQRAALSGSLVNSSAGVFDLTGGMMAGPVNNAGTFTLTNGSVSGVFTNSGTVTALGNTSMGGFVGSGSGIVNMLTPSGGGVPTADRLTINGDVNSGIFAMDLNIGTDKAVDSGGNPINPTGGTSDQIAVTGNISGALHFDFINKAPAGVGPFLGDAVLVLDGANASDTYTTTHSGLGAGGAVVYSLAKIGDDLKVVSETSAGIGGVAANASLVQSLIGTVVNRPTSPFVSGLATEEGCSRGGYLRGTYGVTTVSGSSNNSISTSSSSVRARYAGAQGGYDFGCNDGRFFDGWDGSFGAMVGYNTGKSDQDVAVGVSGGGTAVASITHSKFDQKYIGAYTAFAKDRITTDVQVRLEKTNFELNETVLPGFFGLGLNNAKFSTNSTNITGRFSYRMDLNDEGLNLVPTAGLSYTHTSGSTVNFAGGESLHLSAFDSIVGFVGGTLAKTKIAPEGNAGTTYFGSANYYHDFAGDRKSVFTDALGGTQNITTKNIGGFGELSMGVNYVRILENGAAGAKQLNANVRLDTRFGSNVKKSASLTAQIRLSF